MSRNDSAMEINEENSIELISSTLSTDVVPSTPDMNDLKRDNTVLCSTPTKDIKRVKIENEKEENKENVDDNIAFEVDEEFEAARRFYKIFKGLNKYDITEAKYMYWKKTPGVGKYYKEYIQSIPLKLVLVQVVNEWAELAKLYKLEMKQIESKSVNLLMKYLKQPKYLNSDCKDLEGKTPEFLEFKKNCHLKRMGFLKFFIKENYDIDYDKFKSYVDIKWFIKNNSTLLN